MNDFVANGITGLMREDAILGFCVILMSVAAILYRKLTTLYKQRDEQKDEINSKLFELMEKRIESDIKHEQAFKNLREMIERLVDRL